MTTTTTAPLERYTILGIVERWYQAPIPGAPKQPAGSCWHCGQGIAYCVQIRNIDTGDVHEIGTTCAERVGLTAAELKQHLAALYAEQRAEASAANRAKRLADDEAAEAARVATFGPHGTTGRYESGCYCEACRHAAPHGTVDRFHNGCTCPDCVAAIVADDPKRWIIWDTRTVLVDLTTGRTVTDAKDVTTRYGSKWRIDRTDAWLPWMPARRNTLAAKGFTEAEVPALLERCGNRQNTWTRLVCTLADPIVDAWGTPIPTPTQEEV